MRKFVSVIWVLLAMMGIALAETEIDASSLFVQEAELFAVEWTFPVTPEEMDERFVKLVNPHYLLESTFVPEPLMTMVARKSAPDGNNANGGVRKCSTVKMELQQNCGEALVRLFDEAEKQGMMLYLKSAYRSYQTQKTQYYNRLSNNHGKDDGWVAKPGASDHQTGLGCDVLNYEWRNRSMNSTFIQTAEAQWMEAHCAEFGFVIRYPSGK